MGVPMHTATRPVHIGYNPPSGRRGLETVDPVRYVADLEAALAVAGPAIDSLWISDHFMTEERWRLECWTLLTWIAARHPGIPIGPIVAARAYRHPPLLAKMLASLDALMASAAAAEGIAPGRPILGYGAGWDEAEYRAYGYDFPPAGERVAQLDEALAAIRLLWRGGPVDFTGPTLRLAGATCVPRPDPAPLVMVGGEGRATMRVAVRHADWWNMLHRPADRIGPILERLDAACVAEGRDPATLRRSLYLTVFLHRDDATARRAAGPRTEDPDVPAFAGSPARLVDHLGGLVARGIDAFQLVFAGWPEHEDLALFAAEVRPAFPR